MSDCSDKECEGSCSYFVTVPGGDSLLCKPFAREHFYHLERCSSSNTILQAIYCKGTCRKPRCGIYDDSCTCSCICDRRRYPRLCPDICKLTEMVDTASSMSDLASAALAESKAQTEEIVVKDRKEQTHKRKSETKHHKKKCTCCSCPPGTKLCLQTSSAKRDSVSEVASQSDGDVLLPKPPRRKSKPSAENASHVTSQSDGDVLLCEPCKMKVNRKVPVSATEKNHSHPKRCLCKDKTKTSKTKNCKCNISPPIVICDKQPNKNRSFLETIRGMISNQSKTSKPVSEEGTSAVVETPVKADEAVAQREGSGVTVSTISRSQRYSRKLSSIKEQPSQSSQDAVETIDSKSTGRKMEVESSTRSKRLSSEGSKQVRRSTTSKEKERKDSRASSVAKSGLSNSSKNRNGSKTAELNTLFINKSELSTDRSIFMNPEDKTVQFLFLETYERFPFCKLTYGLQNVTCDYKSVLWVSLKNLSDVLQLRGCKRLQVSRINTRDKFSQVTCTVDDHNKNFLSIVKKFEEYKRQQRVLEDMKRAMICKEAVKDLKLKEAIREKRQVYLSRIRHGYTCRIFCEVVAPVIYFIYFVVFIWVTFQPSVLRELF